ncbi:lanthionine synthetase C family protein [Flagellimonas sp.]|uniref:lanthionine synthetase C family protein n=1 Tax=Flagellimonas sp. TaxID=2058762 RepID=UPI003AB14FD9
MKNTPFFQKKLREINHIVKNQYKDLTEVGVIAGISGLALFQYYYSKYLDVDEHGDFGSKMLSYSIEKINSGYSTPTFSSGIAGLGWTIQHLDNRDFIDVDCDNLLSHFDQYLYDHMISDFSNGNYDFLHGALGYGFYFLCRYRSTEDIDLKNRYQSYLLESVTSLKNLSISKEGIIKWESILDIEKRNKGFNLSLSHGISSILNYLSRIYEIGIERKETRRLIQGGINFILSFENKNARKTALFPSWIENNKALEYNGRVAWCYGDLGIGISLLRAATSIADRQLQLDTLEILYHTTTRKLPSQTLVNDAGICHGSYGNALIYHRLFQESKNNLFKKSLDFWIEDGIKKAIHKDGYAGYKHWYPSKNSWSSELTLLEGIAGIGLVIIDFLSSEPNDWDECLLIS